MKYIIEIEEEPFVRQSELFGEDALYRAKGFKSLVFDEVGISKLTPYAEPDLEQARKEAYEEGYKKCLSLNNFGHLCVSCDKYEQGLADAWEAARKIALMDTETSENVTGYFGLFRIMENLTPMQAIEKLKAYEEQKKANDEIKVGDEVKNRTDDCGVVTGIYGNDTYVLWQDGSTGNHAANELIKTGRHFNFLTSLLEAMK